MSVENRRLSISKYEEKHYNKALKKVVFLLFSSEHFSQSWGMHIYYIFSEQRNKANYIAVLLSSTYFARVQASELTKIYLAMTSRYFGRVEQNVL